MQVLEKRFYSRAEISTICGEDTKDNHFKRNVENKLNKLGYKYIYSRKGVEITYIPETPEEKLIQLLQTDFNLDIKIDFKAFAYFIHAFNEIEGFAAMPWAEREQMLKDAYNIEVSERTLRKWCNKLFDNNSAVKIEAAKVYWRTIKADGKSYRELVSGDDELEQEMRDYYSYRRKLLKVMSWEETNKELWSKYGCCYYSCKFIAFSAFGDNGNLLELYELIKQIIDNDRE